MRRTKAEAAETRREILDAAARLFAANGTGVPAIEAVASSAGLTRGAVYWHFKDKQQLFTALWAQLNEPLDRMFADALDSAEPLQALRGICIEFIVSLQSNECRRRMMMLMLSNPQLMSSCNAQHGMRDKCLGKFEALLVSAQKRRQVARTLDTKLAALATLCFVSGVALDYLKGNHSRSLKRIAPQLVDFHLRTLAG